MSNSYFQMLGAREKMSAIFRSLTKISLMDLSETK